MKSIGLRLVPLAIVAVLLLLPSMGCNGSDPLETGYEPVSIQVALADGSEGYECVLLDLLSLHLRPLDPQADQVLDRDLTLFSTSQRPVDFNPDATCPVTSVTLPGTSLPQGVYEVVSLEIQYPTVPTLRDVDNAANNVNCTGVEEVAGDFSPPLMVTIGPGPNVLRLVVDVAAFRDAIQGNNCQALFTNIENILEIQ